MAISAVFAVAEDGNQKVKPSLLGTVPATGTPIKQLCAELLDALLLDVKSDLFYLGKVYGTNIKMPTWFKHFGDRKDGKGAGEAYHLGVFGKTGSGKSVLAKMVMSAYANHVNMSQFILDPQGEFARDLNERGNLKRYLENFLGRKINIIGIHDLVLTGWSLFKKILVSSRLLINFGIKSTNNQEIAASQIIKALKKATSPLEQRSNKLEDIHQKENFNLVLVTLKDKAVLEKIYAGKDAQMRVENAVIDEGLSFFQEWVRVANLFKVESSKIGNNVQISNLVRENLLGEPTITIIDLSEGSVPSDKYWNDSIKYLIINEFIKNIVKVAELNYKKQKLLNCLIILDEAHRLVPREKQDNEEMENVRQQLRDAIRTTRKYGLGWMFISQTLSSLDRELLNQIRIFFFGFGLGWGVERQALRELIGGAEESIRLYQMFNDPQSSLGEPSYPFMSIGPVSPLSFSGSPLFFNALDYPIEFLKLNSNKGAQ
ncbi:MAG: ATP-binding protein [Promethearchaeota archaeon]